MVFTLFFRKWITNINLTSNSNFEHNGTHVQVSVIGLFREKKIIKLIENCLGTYSVASEECNPALFTEITNNSHDVKNDHFNKHCTSVLWKVFPKRKVYSVCLNVHCRVTPALRSPTPIYTPAGIKVTWDYDLKETANLLIIYFIISHRFIQVRICMHFILFICMWNASVDLTKENKR